jgi:hypothetical protein
MSHILEAFEIVEEIQKSKELNAAVLACDAQTKKSSLPARITSCWW